MPKLQTDRQDRQTMDR